MEVDGLAHDLDTAEELLRRLQCAAVDAERPDADLPRLHQLYGMAQVVHRRVAAADPYRAIFPRRRVEVEELRATAVRAYVGALMAHGGRLWTEAVAVAGADAAGLVGGVPQALNAVYAVALTPWDPSPAARRPRRQRPTRG